MAADASADQVILSGAFVGPRHGVLLSRSCLVLCLIRVPAPVHVSNAKIIRVVPGASRC